MCSIIAYRRSGQSIFPQLVPRNHGRADLKFVRYRPLLFGLFLTLIAEGFFLFRRPGPPWIASILAVQVSSAGPLLFILAQRRSVKWSSFYITQMGVAFGLSMFFVTDWSVWGTNVLVSDLALNDALAVTAVGIGACGLGILWNTGQNAALKSNDLLAFRPLWGGWRFWLVSYFCTLWISHFAKSDQLGFVVVLASHWPLTAIIAMDSLARCGRAPQKLLRIVWLIFVPLRLLMDFGTGFGMFVVSDAIVLLFYLTVRHVIKIRVYGIVLFALLIIVVYTGRSYIRNMMWEYPDQNPTTRLGMATAALSGISNYTLDDFIESIQSLIAGRVGYYTLVAHTLVVSETPERIPYLEGKSLYGLAWAFVPRFIYPAKPIQNWGQDFGHRYGLLSPSDSFTSFNFPQLTEAYANGGVWMVFIMMLFLSSLVQSVGTWAERLDPHSDDVLWLILPLVFGAITACFSNVVLGVDDALYTAILLAAPTCLAMNKKIAIRRAPPSRTKP